MGCVCVCVLLEVTRWCAGKSHQAINAIAVGNKLTRWQSSRSISNYHTGRRRTKSSLFVLFPIFLSPSFSHPSSPCFSLYSDLHLSSYLSQSVSVSFPTPLSLSICPLFLSLSLSIHPSLFLTFSFSINRMSPGGQLSVNVCMQDVWVYAGVSLVSPVGKLRVTVQMRELSYGRMENAFDEIRTSEKPWL